MKKILAVLIAVWLCLALCSSAMARGPHGPGPGGFHGPAPYHGGFHPGPAPYRPAPPPPPPRHYYRPAPPPPPYVVPYPYPGYYYSRPGIYLGTPNVGISIGL